MTNTNRRIDEDTADIIRWLDARGVTVRAGDTGAVEMGGRCAFVRERVTAAGATQIVIKHQSSRGTTYQRFSSSERALAAIKGTRS